MNEKPLCGCAAERRGVPPPDKAELACRDGYQYAYPAGGDGCAHPPEQPDAYGLLLRELSAIGNSMNQIAHWANARESISEAEI